MEKFWREVEQDGKHILLKVNSFDEGDGHQIEICFYLNDVFGVIKLGYPDSEFESVAEIMNNMEGEALLEVIKSVEQKYMSVIDEKGG